MGSGLVIGGTTAGADGTGVLRTGAAGGSFQPGIFGLIAAGIGGGTALDGVGAELVGGVYPVFAIGGGGGTMEGVAVWP